MRGRRNQHGKDNQEFEQAIWQDILMGHGVRPF